MKELTPKQEKFCNLYIKLGNASEAYRQAYEVTNKQADWIASKASHYLAQDNIRTRVAELQEQTKQKHSIDRDYIIKGLLEIISDVDYTFNLGKDSKLTKEDSKAFYRIMQQTKNTDKLRALETLAKMLGLNEPEQLDVNIKSFKTNWG